MMMLTETASAQPDYVALAMVLALAVIVAIMAIRKKVLNNRVNVTEEPIAVVEKPVAPGSAGQVKLHNVEPKTAAMLMAIVADKLEKPLNELRFISIKEVE